MLALYFTLLYFVFCPLPISFDLCRSLWINRWIRILEQTRLASVQKHIQVDKWHKCIYFFLSSLQLFTICMQPCFQHWFYLLTVLLLGTLCFFFGFCLYSLLNQVDNFCIYFIFFVHLVLGFWEVFDHLFFFFFRINLNQKAITKRSKR